VYNAHSCEDGVILSSFILTQYRRAMDRQKCYS